MVVQYRKGDRDNCFIKVASWSYSDDKCKRNLSTFSFIIMISNLITNFELAV